MYYSSNCYSEEEIRTTMIDAGFQEDDIERFLQYLNSNEKTKAFQIIKKHRKELLDHLHMTQDCISCVDYLNYRITNE